MTVWYQNLPILTRERFPRHFPRATDMPKERKASRNVSLNQALGPNKGKIPKKFPSSRRPEGHGRRPPVLNPARSDIRRSKSHAPIFLSADRAGGAGSKSGEALVVTRAQNLFKVVASRLGIVGLRSPGVAGACVAAAVVAALYLARR